MTLPDPARGGMSRMFFQSRGLPIPALRAAAAPAPAGWGRPGSRVGDGSSGSGSGVGGGAPGSGSAMGTGSKASGSPGSATTSLVTGSVAGGAAGSGARSPEIRTAEWESDGAVDVSTGFLRVTGGSTLKDRTSTWIVADATMEARRTRRPCLRRVATLARLDATADTACRSPPGKVLPHVPPRTGTAHSLDPI